MRTHTYPFPNCAQVEDQDDLFFEDPVSEHDSDDSNAESYYANSYPDEDSCGGGSDRDEEDEEERREWCHVVARGSGAGRAVVRAAAGERWDDEVSEGCDDTLFRSRGLACVCVGGGGASLLGKGGTTR